MESIKVHQRVGQDGILHLDLPIGLTAQDVDVMVIYQPAQGEETSEQSLEQLYGVCADDPIVIDDQRTSDSFDDDLAGACE